MEFSSASCHFLLAPSDILHTLFGNILNLFYSFNMKDQVAHPYKTTGRNLSPVYFNLNFLDSMQEDKYFECKETSSP
jgi:hypothetical protein